MTEAERKLLIWCAVLHLRTTPLEPEEADEIDALIEEVRRGLRKPPADASPGDMLAAIADAKAETLLRKPA